MGAAPIILVVGIIGLIALMVGGKKAHAGPARELPPGPLPPPVPETCTPADHTFVSNILIAAQKRTATIEQIDKAIATGTDCNWDSEILQLKAERAGTLRDQSKVIEKAEETGIVRPVDIKAEEPDYVCGILPGKGYACRAKNSKWRAKAKKFQMALNIAATKLPAIAREERYRPGLATRAETPKLIKLDGRIGNKTVLLLKKVAPRIDLTGFSALKVMAASATPERISKNLTILTATLTRYVQLKSGKAPSPVSGESSNPAPLPGVSPEQWGSFVRCMKGRGGEKGLGMFKMNPARLKKLGVKSFPKDTKGQYELFAHDMREQAKAVLVSPYLRNAVGQEVGGTVISLSGVLALMKQAGPKGAVSWLKKPKDRKKFPNTTEAFNASNGIF